MTESTAVPLIRRVSVTRVITTGSWSRRIAVGGILCLVLAAVLAPWLTPYDPSAIDPAHGLLAPNLSHPFGTDQLGRDVLTRVLYGARIDLLIGAVGVAIPMVAGVAIGLFVGYRGGWVDAVVGRVIDVVTAFPFLVLVIAVVAMLGPGLKNFFIAVAIVSWVSYARIVRGQVLTAKKREYVLAARSLGYSDWRIMFRHLLPNVVAPAVVFASTDFVLDIVAGASLGFFGLGVPPSVAEWGVMIADGRAFVVSAPWVVIFPGLAIITVSFFFGLLGDVLADAVRGVDG